MTVEDGRVTKIDGDRRSPITEGFICGKVRKLADHLYCDERVLTPLVRTGAQGSGSFRPASWDEALELITAKLRGLSHPEALLPYHSGRSNRRPTEGCTPGADKS